MSKASKPYKNMTPAERAEVQDKMNVLCKLGFYIDDTDINYPLIIHKSLDFMHGLDMANFELTDFIPLVYNLGKTDGKNEQYDWGGWDRWGNHEATGTKFNRDGFSQDETHYNGTCFDSARVQYAGT